MKTLAVFDPAISYFDPVLVQFAAYQKWIEKHGVKVSRHNLGKELQAFAANPAVVREMEAGMDRLPVIMVDCPFYPFAQRFGIYGSPTGDFKNDYKGM